ncbi:MAG: fatty acid desaturase [Alphaproteobacteria bacterium]|nr:fatty acid desaturase [Alphaproteobacteria bacterium]
MSVDLSKRRDGPGLAHLSGHLALLAATGGLCLTVTGIWLFPAMLIHGVVLSFLFCPLHESVHRTAFRTGWLNRAVADAVGFLMVLPPRWFTAFHLAHHRFTQDPGRDPELASPKPTTVGRYLYVLSGFDYWHRAVGGLLTRARGKADDSFLDTRLMTRAVREARIYLGLYVATALLATVLGPRLFLVLWIGPALLGQPFLRAYLLAEHWGCPAVKDMWANTRTTLSLAPVRWLAWNMPFHAEHHANPGIPFHALPAYAKAEAHQRHVVASGYTAFHTERLEALRAGTAEPV